VVQDGEKALRFFEQLDRDDTTPCPVLVIIDINLPKKHGGEVLQEMRRSRRCANALVLVVTSSDSASDRDAMAKLGVNGYFRKPSEYDEFMKLGEVVLDLLTHFQESRVKKGVAES
jgi:DNA-binding response OmpR family regulator